MNEGLTNYTLTNGSERNHFDTPAYAVYPLLPYINPKWKVWEPTDTYGRSKITSVLKQHGCNVIATNEQEIDFIHEPTNFDDELWKGQGIPDLIITNPPFNIKDDFIDSCIYYQRKSDIRWALLLPITSLEGIYRGTLFRMTHLQLMIFDKRVEYLQKTGSTFFNSSWFCSGLSLPSDLFFYPLQKV